MTKTKNPFPEPDSGKRRARRTIQPVRNARFSFRISGRYLLSFENSCFTRVAFLSPTYTSLRRFITLLNI